MYVWITEEDMGIFGVGIHAPVRDLIWVCVAYLQLAIHIDLYRGTTYFDAVAVPTTRYYPRDRFRHQGLLPFSRKWHQRTEPDSVCLLCEVVAAALSLVTEYHPSTFPRFWRKVLAQLLLILHPYRVRTKLRIRIFCNQRVTWHPCEDEPWFLWIFGAGACLLTRRIVTRKLPVLKLATDVESFKALLVNPKLSLRASNCIW